MVWQKIVGYVHEDRIQVESKSGKVYPVELEYAHHNDLVYTNQVNSNIDRTLWADVDLSDDDPTTDRIETSHPKGGPPDIPSTE